MGLVSKRTGKPSDDIHEELVSEKSEKPGPSEIMAEQHRQDSYKNKSLKQKAYDLRDAIAGVPPYKRSPHYEGIADTSKRHKEHR